VGLMRDPRLSRPEKYFRGTTRGAESWSLNLGHQTDVGLGTTWTTT
jgi:hypothetical protein